MTYNQPNNKGFYGQFGGQFVPETLMTAVKQLEEAYVDSKKDPLFQAELKELLKDYVGRENPLYYAKRLRMPVLSACTPGPQRSKCDRILCVFYDAL